METKKEIRKQIRKIRKSMEMDAWKRATDTIEEKVIASDNFREATDIYCYMNFDGEVETTRILEEAWRLGKDVWLPKTFGDDMEFYQAFSVDELKEGSYGILEPSEEHAKAPGDDGLVIVPGVAFDVCCNRIGYGKGYYDKYLTKHPNLVTIGIAFDIQIVDQIPTDAYDRPLDQVITETETYMNQEN